MNEQEGLRLLGKKVKELRKGQNLTQAEFAEKLGFSTNYVGMIERVERNIPTGNLFIIAEVSGVKVKDLFDFE